MKRKRWKLLVVGLLAVPLGLGGIVQAESALQQSSQTVQTETSTSETAQANKLEVSQTETQQTETSHEEETSQDKAEQPDSPDVTNLNPTKLAVPEQEVMVPDPETNEIAEEDAKSASLPVEAYAAATLKPVYRVYNPNSGEHLHTLNGGEKDNLMSLGWVYEGISMQINGSGSNYTVPIIRTQANIFTLKIQKRSTRSNVQGGVMKALLGKCQMADRKFTVCSIQMLVTQAAIITRY